MSEPIYIQHIRQLRRRLDELIDHHPVVTDGLFEETLEELRVSLEELRQSQEELERQNSELFAARLEAQNDRQRYLDLFDHAPDAYLITDSAGTIRQANQAAGTLFGIRPLFLEQKPLLVFVAPEDRKAYLAQLVKLPGGEMLDWEMHVCPRGAKSLPVSVRAVAAREGGPQVDCRWVLRDISALHEARQQALQAERLAAIGQMVAGLAHESGNALQRGQACLEMIGTHLQDRPAGQTMLARALEAQNDLHWLYDSVRNYAGPVAIQRADCDLGLVIARAWDNLSGHYRERDVQLRSDTDGLDLCIQADRIALVRVFRNILENALAACADPVRLEVRWAPAELAGQPAVCAVVRDNGPGLAPEQQKRIFEPFFTTKTHGTGLGMAIARRIVEAHEGRLEARNADGPGAEIVVTLPREAP